MKKALIAGAMALVSMSAYSATPASFPGGDDALMSFLSTNVTYPAMAQENGIEGTVIVLFAVATDGAITNIHVARPLDPDLEEEALRVVKIMPAWIPATDDSGTPVSSDVTLPVKFRLNKL